MLKILKLKMADKYLAVGVINTRKNLSKSVLELFTAGSLKSKSDCCSPSYELLQKRTEQTQRLSYAGNISVIAALPGCTIADVKGSVKSGRCSSK